MDNNMNGLNKLYVIGYQDGKEKGSRMADSYTTEIDKIMGNAADSIERDSSLKSLTDTYSVRVKKLKREISEGNPDEYVDGYNVGFDEGIFPHTELIDSNEKKM